MWPQLVTKKLHNNQRYNPLQSLVNKKWAHSFHLAMDSQLICQDYTSRHPKFNRSSLQCLHIQTDALT
jgi:hypothetical protein